MESQGAGAGQAAGPTPGANPPAGAADAFDQIDASTTGQGQDGGQGQGADPGANPPQGAPKLFAGRFKSPEELEEAYYESGREGRRLYELTKSLGKERGDFETKVRDFEAQLTALRSQSAFKELSDAELQKLREENPASYIDYLRDKDKRDGAIRTEKEKAEAARKESEDKKRQTEEAISRGHREMLTDPKRYPGYRELQPAIDQVLDIAPELAGHDWTPKILYYVAKGLQSLRAERQALSQTDEERRKAEAEASARAGTTGTPGRPGQTGAAGDGLDELNREIMAGARKSVLPSF